MLDTLCEPSPVEKTRYLVPRGNHTWEIDVFHGNNEGLIIAEIELSDEHEPFEKPDWLGEEVTHDKRYRNARLSQEPFLTWKSSK